MKSILALLFCGMCYTAVYSQSVNCKLTLKGVIVDSSHHELLSNGNIEIIGTKFKTASNSNGEFMITNVCPDSLELHVSHMNCEHIHLKINFYSDTFITIYLKHEILQFKNVGIIDKSNSSHLQLVNPNKNINSIGANISSLMNEITGINLLKTGFHIGKPMIDGMHGNRVLVINNSIRQEGQNWGMEHAPEIDPFLATEIELLKGANTLRYGSDGIGGVILINSPSIFNQKKSNLLSGEINSGFSSNGKGAVVSGILKGSNIGKLPLYWRIQGSSKRFGNVHTSNDVIANTGMKENNFSGQIAYHNSKFSSELFYSQFNNITGIYTGSQSGNLSDLQNAMKSDRPLIQSDFTYSIQRPYQSVKHQLLKLNQKYILNSHNGLEMNLSFQNNHRSEYDILRSSSSFQGPAFDYYIKTYMGELLWNYYNFHKINFKIGTNGMYQSNAYTGKYFIPGFYNKGIGVFGLVDKTLKKWHFEGAIRFDNKHLESFIWKGDSLKIDNKYFNGLTYCIKAEYQLNKQHHFSIIHGMAWRPPAPNELYANGLHQGLASIEIGNSNLIPEKAFNQSILYEYSSKTRSLQVEYYYKFIKNYINLVPSNSYILSIRGAFPSFNYISQDVSIQGINFKIEQQLSRNYEIKLRGNLLNGKDLRTKQYLNQMPPYQLRFSIQKQIKSLKLSIHSNTNFRQFRYEDNSDYIDPPKGFTILSLESEYQINKKKLDLFIGLSINNLLNTSYREYLNRSRYFIEAPGRNIQFNIKIPFNIKKSIK